MDYSFVDSHCHLLSSYYLDVSNVISEALDCGVNKFIVSGFDSLSNKEVLDVINRYDCCYGTIGIHPSVASSYSDEDILFLKSHVLDDKVIGIGEIGLDYHYEGFDKDAQLALFRKQMQIASDKHLPVVIHSRDATMDTINVLKEFPLVKGVIHSFSLSYEVAKIYIGLGYKLGINGVVTFKNCHLKEIIKDIVSDIILETDSPYLAPVPYRGSENAPKYIYDIACFIALNAGISLVRLSLITNKNVLDCFARLSD